MIGQLCDCGVATALPEIQRLMRRGEESERTEEDIRFCEARMRRVQTDPDRAKALGSVLRVDGTTENSRLISWAINQLDSIRTPEADAELDKFAAQLAKLPPEHPLRQFAFEGEIRTLRGMRGQ